MTDKANSSSLFCSAITLLLCNLKLPLQFLQYFPQPVDLLFRARLGLCSWGNLSWVILHERAHGGQAEGDTAQGSTWNTIASGAAVSIFISLPGAGEGSM